MKKTTNKIRRIQQKAARKRSEKKRERERKHKKIKHLLKENRAKIRKLVNNPNKFQTTLQARKQMTETKTNITKINPLDLIKPKENE